MEQSRLATGTQIADYSVIVSVRVILAVGKQSLDRISLDIFSWSKFSNNLGVWSKVLFFYFGQLIEFHLTFSVDRKF